MREDLIQLLQEALQRYQAVGSNPMPLQAAVILTVPKNEAYGDYATNLALSLAKDLKQSPMKIAEELLAYLPSPVTWLEKVEVVRPGFINFFLTDQAFQSVLPAIIKAARRYGEASWGAGERIQIEFVSANPTGPLHVGHGRGAALGEALTNLLRSTGHTVETEYYLNDLGTQMETLGRSIQARFRELKGEDLPFPEDGYQGDYIREIAADLQKRIRQGSLSEEALDLSFFSRYGRETILAGIREDLQNFGILFDHWFSEESLVQQGLVQDLIKKMKSKALFYDQEGALWFKSSAFGDDKDRVVVRSNGALTYFATDIAYHHQKFGRGFQRLIDIWGADHHGYLPRLKAALGSLGYEPDRLRVVLVQLVNLLRQGKPVAMSTRAGEFVTLREVLEEVGKDAARFIFLTRRSDSPLDFDLDLAKKQSNENPVYYVQYAHARVCSVLALARSQGIDPAGFKGGSLSRLTLPEEKRLCKTLAEYPEEVTQAAARLEPHRLPFYLTELAAQFHYYYNHHRFLTEDRDLTEARLMLVQSIGIVINNALTLLGVEAPEKM